MMNKEKLDMTAKALTAQSDHLDLIYKALELVEYNQDNGDDFATHLFIKSGGLSLILDNLKTVSKTIQSVSNELVLVEAEVPAHE